MSIAIEIFKNICSWNLRTAITYCMNNMKTTVQYIVNKLLGLAWVQFLYTVHMMGIMQNLGSHHTLSANVITAYTVNSWRPTEIYFDLFEWSEGKILKQSRGCESRL
jgi:hypothetical protein